MTPETFLWLALLAALAALFVLTLRRMSKLSARTHDLDHFQQAVDAIDLRFATVIEPVIRDLDLIRRNAGDPEVLAADLGALDASLDGLLAESRTLPVPPGVEPLALAMIGELERAGRAADMAGHGLGILTATGRGRELEAQTSLKRGALNLRHARDAYGGLARDTRALRPADLAGRKPGEAAVTASLAAYAGPDADDADGRFDHRM